MMALKTPRSKMPVRVRLALILFVVVLLVAGAFAYFHLRKSPEYRQTPPQGVSSKPGVEGKKRTSEQLASYSVPPSSPRQLSIPNLNIKANILPVGRETDGAMSAPSSAWDVGWYNQSAKPGPNTGALLIDGHVNDELNVPGVFFELVKLKPGDTMQVERGDKQIFNYKVVLIEQKKIEEVDMAKMMRSITPGKQGLNLITCGGSYDQARKTYDQRVLVYAERTS